MAKFKPIKAIRPYPQYASQVAALPYDVMSSKEAKEKAAGNPYSFLHVDKAEIDFAEDIDIYDQRVYLKAKENLEKAKNNTADAMNLVREESSKLDGKKAKKVD